MCAGLWLNIPDYDAPTQMVKPRERNVRYVDAVMTIPKVKTLRNLISHCQGWHTTVVTLNRVVELVFTVQLIPATLLGLT